MTEAGAKPSPPVGRARWSVAVVAGAVVAPLLVTVAWGLRLPLPAAVALAALLAAAAVVGLARRLPAEVDELARTRRTLAVLWLVAGIAAAGQTARVSTFMVEPRLHGYSAIPFNGFFVSHSCLSAYTEALRFVQSGQNIYDQAHYDRRKIGRFEVDFYQYPPPFMVLPGLQRAIQPDFFRLRALWFGVQGLTLAATLLLVARWIGGRPGLLAGLLGVIVWLTPQTLLTLQIGNFQVGTFALSILAVLAFARGRILAGAPALGFATASKLYPAVVILDLLLRRRWAAALASTAFVVAFALLAYALYGPLPYQDFVSYQVPRIASGEAFSWIEMPAMKPVNHSIHGLVLKVGALGLPGMTSGVANAASAVFMVLLAGLTLLASRRREPTAAPEDAVARAFHMAVALALLNLASFRSPFTPDAYAFLGTIWLLTLLAASAPAARERRRWLLPVLLLFPVLDGILPPEPPRAVVALTVAFQVLGIAVSVWTVVRATRNMSAPVAGASR